MKKYDRYKPTNIFWLPQIPFHWEMRRSKYFFKYTTGFTPPSGQDEFYNGNLTWVTIADMNQKIISDSVNTLSSLAIERYKPDVTKKNSLLFSFKLSVGKVAFAGKDLYTNEAIISILPDENYDVRYFFYSLPEQLLQNANENIYGAKMLNQELIRNAFVCYPPKAEQTCIANYLDEKTIEADNLIFQKQRLIELLKEERIAITNTAVTKGLDPKVKMKSSGVEWIGDIPTHWKVTRVKYICTVQGRIGFKGYKSSDLVNEGEGALVLGATHITRDHKIDISEPVFLSWEKYYESPEIMVKQGDVVFTQRGVYLGKVALIDRDYGDITINPSLILLKDNLINSGYLTFFLTSHYVRKSIELISSNTAIPMISQENLSNFYCVVPPAKEQEKIFDFVNKENSKIDLTISQIEKEIELMQEYRAALISEVITGKVKVIS